MKEILTGNGFVKDILRAWCVNNTTYYVPSKFIVISDDKPYIAYNTLTRTLVELDDKEKDILIGDKIYYNDKIDYLIQKNYLVPEDLNEVEVAEQVLSLGRTLKKKSDFINLYTILTTTDCNARCFYCYEAGIKKNNMTEETAYKVVEFIKNNYGGETVRLNWFGGEPLYNSKVIDIICSELMANNIEYYSTMTSNGYLFDDELVKKSVGLWHLRQIQITLDGTEEVYNRVKNYIYDEDVSPFVKVCDNIERLINKKIKVKIRLNLDEHNLEDLLELVQYINNRYKDKKYLFVYVSLLFDLDGTKLLADKIKLSEIKNSIEEYLSDNHLYEKKLRNHLPANHCMADNDAATLINPDGGLARCEHYVYDDVYGSIYNPSVRDEDNILSWKKLSKKTAICNECNIYPLCFWPEKCIEGRRQCDEADRYSYVNNIKKYMRYEWRRSVENGAVTE